MTTRYLWTLEREGRSTRSGLDAVEEIISIIVSEDVLGAMPKPTGWSRSCGSMPTRTDRRLTNLRWLDAASAADGCLVRLAVRPRCGRQRRCPAPLEAPCRKRGSMGTDIAHSPSSLENAGNIRQVPGCPRISFDQWKFRLFTFKVSMCKSGIYPEPDTMPRPFPNARDFR